MPLPGGLRARRGDVRSAILGLLAEEPMHGYQIISELERRSDGRWRPSAGSVYPRSSSWRTRAWSAPPRRMGAASSS